MSFLDEIIMNTKSAIDTIGKKAGKVVDVSKLRIRQAELTKDLNKAYERIGKTVYDCTKKGISFTDDLNSQILEIDSIYKNLENVKESIKKAKNEIKSRGDSDQKFENRNISSSSSRPNLSDLSNIKINNQDKESNKEEETEKNDETIEYSSEDIELNDEER